MVARLSESAVVSPPAPTGVGAAPVPVVIPARQRMLDATAFRAAQSWMQALVAELEEQGRPIEGGWPGTINEARGRCGMLAARELATRSLPALAHEELTRLTRITYDEARRLWRSSDRAAT